VSRGETMHGTLSGLGVGRLATGKVKTVGPDQEGDKADPKRQRSFMPAMGGLRGRRIPNSLGRDFSPYVGGGRRESVRQISPRA